MNDLPIPNYPDFDDEDERRLFLSASKRKLIVDNMHQEYRRDVRWRFCVMKYRYLRSSTKHKKEFLLETIRNISSLETLVQVMFYIRYNTMKISTYEHACDPESSKSKFLVDHDRTLDKKTLKTANEDDISWLKENPYLQEILIPELISLCPNICRLFYTEISNIYKDKLKEEGLTVETCITPFSNLRKPVDDSNSYPKTTSTTEEVDKLRKKWSETFEKYKNEVQTIYNKLHPVNPRKNREDVKKGEKKQTKTPKIKSKKDGSKGNDLDWIQVLPIWIVKKIFSYLDDKTLTNSKKVNPYWKYVCENILKERKAKKSLSDTINKMKSGIDPKYFKEFEDLSLDVNRKERTNQYQRKINQLKTRGAVKRTIFEKKCQKSQIIISSVEDTTGNADDFISPVQYLSLFPRCVKEDLMLYREHIFPLKDVNIIIDIGGDSYKKVLDTLSYSLSEKLSDTFSVSEADLSGW